MYQHTPSPSSHSCQRQCSNLRSRQYPRPMAPERDAVRSRPPHQPSAVIVGLPVKLDAPISPTIRYQSKRKADIHQSLHYLKFRVKHLKTKGEHCVSHQPAVGYTHKQTIASSSCSLATLNEHQLPQALRTLVSNRRRWLEQACVRSGIKYVLLLIQRQEPLNYITHIRHVILVS